MHKHDHDTIAGGLVQGIAYALYGEDRPIAWSVSDDPRESGLPYVEMTPDERKVCYRIRDRVMKDLARLGVLDDTVHELGEVQIPLEADGRRVGSITVGLYASLPPHAFQTVGA